SGLRGQPLGFLQEVPRRGAGGKRKVALLTDTMRKPQRVARLSGKASTGLQVALRGGEVAKAALQARSESMEQGLVPAVAGLPMQRHSGLDAVAGRFQPSKGLVDLAQVPEGDGLPAPVADLAVDRESLFVECAGFFGAVLVLGKAGKVPQRHA